MSGYSYRPLEQASSIRILLLEPALNREEVLLASLSHISLVDQQKDVVEGYTALSYVWGDPTDTRKIKLGDIEVAITVNLSEALRDLRDATRTHRIWADALCIDQKNVKERNSQVALMRKIFSTASHTIIYLGPSTQEIDALFKAIRPEALEFHRYLLRQIKTSVQLQKAWKRLGWFDEGLINAAISELIQRPWFRRVWVLQKVVVSDSPWIQCDSQRVLWSDLCMLMLMSPFKTSFRSPTLLQLKTMDDTRNSFRKLHSMREFTLWDILARRIGAQATDPRDKVFANMSMAADEKDARKYVEIDYSASIVKVFAAAARYGCEVPTFNSQIRRPLSEVFRYITDSPLRHRLPSWVPDWGVISPLNEIPGRLSKGLNSQPVPNLSQVLVTARSKQCQILGVTNMLPTASGFPPDLLLEITTAELLLERVEKTRLSGIPLPNQMTEFVDVTRSIWSKFAKHLVEEGTHKATMKIFKHEPKGTGDTHMYWWVHILKIMKLYLLSNDDAENGPYASLTGFRGCKRLGHLENGTICLVPSEAIAGDFAVCLYPFGRNYHMPHFEMTASHRTGSSHGALPWLDQVFIVRQHTSRHSEAQASLILQEFSKAKLRPGRRRTFDPCREQENHLYRAKGWTLLWRLQIEHYTLIGQCGGVQAPDLPPWYRDTRVLPVVAHQTWSKLKSKTNGKPLPQSKVRTAYLAALH